jgi:uncharacterized protein YmfQ (DUF2313 family)
MASNPLLFWESKERGGDRHVRRTGDDYAVAFLALLPQGQAWPRQIDCTNDETTLVRVHRGLADYWGFVDGRAADLLERESDPRLTIELLRDWERAWGLPDPCFTEPLSIIDRRNILLLKMTMLGGQSREFFYAVARRLGYGIRITELAPYMTGISRVGDTRGIFNPDSPEHFYWQLGPPEIRFHWLVHVDYVRLRRFHTGESETGIDRLLRIGIASDLECLFLRWKPAHTDIVFDYSGLTTPRPDDAEPIAEPAPPEPAPVEPAPVEPDKLSDAA